MKESIIIAHTLAFLKGKGFTVENVSSIKTKEKVRVEKILNRRNISTDIICKAKERKNRRFDIYGHFKFNRKYSQRRLVVEAKGGKKHYAIYTMLGQFISDKTSSSDYHWFAFALPFTWKSKVKEYLLTEEGGIKPIIKLIMEEYTKKGSGLWFYFVDESGNVTQETWKKTLK